MNKVINSGQLVCKIVLNNCEEIVFIYVLSAIIEIMNECYNELDIKNTISFKKTNDM